VPNPAVELARAIRCWKGNDGSSWYAVGTNTALKAWNRVNTAVADITPAGFTPRPVEVASSSGYGDWTYGSEVYGTERPADEDTAGAFNWCLRNWGQNLLAAPRGAPSRLYEWALDTGVDAAIVANAPQDFDCFHVTDQRIVMVAGAPNEPRRVTWSARENNTVWTPASTNEAGGQTLPGIGKFKEIVTVQDQILLVSETDAYVSRYIGPPYVYGFDQIGMNCGVAAGGAVVATEDFAMWPGAKDFFLFDGSTVQRIECDVMDRFMAERNLSQITKITGFVNPQWSEIWWLFQAGEEDVDSYIYYDWKGGHWGIGKLARTVGGGYAATGGLVMIGTDGYAYNHEETGVVPSDGSPGEVFAETGPIELSGGNITQFVKSIQPDFIHSGEVDLFIIGQDRPGGPETTFGPYRVSYPAAARQPIPARARGHTVRLRIEGVSENWTMGSTRLDFRLGGEK